MPTAWAPPSGAGAPGQHSRGEGARAVCTIPPSGPHQGGGRDPPSPRSASHHREVGTTDEGMAAGTARPRVKGQDREEEQVTQGQMLRGPHQLDCRPGQPIPLHASAALPAKQELNQADLVHGRSHVYKALEPQWLSSLGVGTRAAGGSCELTAARGAAIVPGTSHHWLTRPVLLCWTLGPQHSLGRNQHSAKSCSREN